MPVRWGHRAGQRAPAQRPLWPRAVVQPQVSLAPIRFLLCVCGINQSFSKGGPPTSIIGFRIRGHPKNHLINLHFRGILQVFHLQLKHQKAGTTKVAIYLVLKGQSLPSYLPQVPQRAPFPRGQMLKAW